MVHPKKLRAQQEAGPLSWARPQATQGACERRQVPGPALDSSLSGSGVQPGTTHAHRASLGIRWTPCRRTTVAGKENFTARSPRSQKRWAHSLLTSSPKGPKSYTPNWPAGKLHPFPDPGDHASRHAEHLDGPVPSPQCPLGGEGTSPRSGGQRLSLVLTLGSILRALGYTPRDGGGSPGSCPDVELPPLGGLSFLTCTMGW